MPNLMQILKQSGPCFLAYPVHAPGGCAKFCVNRCNESLMTTDAPVNKKHKRRVQVEWRYFL